MVGDKSPASVTVVIPAWDDYVRFLPEAVDSVRRDAPETPILVLDNASKLPLPELSGVTVVVSPERLTAGAIRNLGIERVETEYVLVLDADDQLLPGTLEFLQSRLRANPDVSICTTAILDGQTGERHRFPRRFAPVLARRPRMFALLDCVWSLFPIQGCALLRTAQVREAGGYADADWGDDWVLAVSLAFRGRVELQDRLGRYYRHTPESLWRRSGRDDLVVSARLVRQRLRRDPGIPTWARALLPVISVLQLAAVYLLRPPYLASREFRGREGP